MIKQNDSPYLPKKEEKEKQKNRNKQQIAEY